MDCRTCIHNSYRDIKDCSHVSCGHPTTQRKSVKWESGDPVWVSVLTGDIPLSRIDELADCPAYEQSA